MARQAAGRVAVCGALLVSLGLGGCDGSVGVGLPMPTQSGPGTVVSGQPAPGFEAKAGTGSDVTAAASAGVGPTASSGIPPFAVLPEGMPGSWHLVFDDEFDGGALDTSHWSTGWLGSGITTDVSSLGIDCDDPSQVSVADGSLALTVVRRTEMCGGVAQPYTTGAVNSAGKESFLYGAFEARIYLPTMAGSGYIADWPAWWADGKNWPDDGEMDIMEGLSGVACYHLRYSASTSHGACASGSFGGWHTYGADWEPGSVTYYYDGYKVGVITNPGVTPAPQFLVLDYAVHAGSKFTQVHSTMEVDYVRVWQH